MSDKRIGRDTDRNRKRLQPHIEKVTGKPAAVRWYSEEELGWPADSVTLGRLTDDEVGEIAVECGSHLCKMRVRSVDGWLVWGLVDSAGDGHHDRSVPPPKLVDALNTFQSLDAADAF